MRFVSTPKRIFAVTAVLCCVIIFSVFSTLGASQHRAGPPNANANSKRAKASAPAPTLLATVRVLPVTSKTEQVSIQGYGNVSAHYSLALNSRIGGQVEALSPHFEAGNRVAKGEVLIQLEASQYQANFADAQATLAQAELDKLEAQRQAQQAEAEWLASGLEGEPESPLVLKLPQQRVAQAALEKAKTNLQNAKINLDSTQIRAPFDAIVTSRGVAPGSYIGAGAELGQLVSTDWVEVRVELSAREWQQLPDFDSASLAQSSATLNDVETGDTWQARILRIEKDIDEASRQRALVLAVEQPFQQQPALYPGTFVTVSILGKRINNVWKLPGTALSQRGEIWLMDADKRLQKLQLQPEFVVDGTLYVVPPESLQNETQFVVVQPLSSYVEGQTIEPMEVSNVN